MGVGTGVGTGVGVMVLSAVTAQPLVMTLAAALLALGLLGGLGFPCYLEKVLGARLQDKASAPIEQGPNVPTP